MRVSAPTFAVKQSRASPPGVALGCFPRNKVPAAGLLPMMVRPYHALEFGFGNRRSYHGFRFKTLPKTLPMEKNGLAEIG